ncbi:DNA repair ATPase [Salmonella phage GEC_vB_MG]|nr:DNA repair ATPase [Salmonella phage GEC_vB_MG]
MTYTEAILIDGLFYLERDMYKDESEMIEKLQKDALKVIQSARIALLQQRPFYGTLLSSLPIIADWRWLPTAATDHRNLYYNPEFIMGMPEERKKKVFSRIDKHPHMTQEQKDDYKEYVNTFYRKKTPKEVVVILAHETRHITNDHMARGKSFDSKMYNIAADQYINTDLVANEFGPRARSLKFFPIGEQTVFDKKREFGFMAYCYCDFSFHGKTAEEIYSEIYNGKVVHGHPMGAHIGDYDPERDILGYVDPHPSLGPVSKDENLAWSAGLIEAALNAAGGEGPKEVRELIARMRKPHIDYMQLIKQRMISRVRSHLSYRKPARRSGSVTQVLRNYGAITHKQSIILPGRNKQDTIDIVIGFDVSGSISKNTLTKIFNEIIGLCLLYKCFRVTLFCWSTCVGEVKIYTQDNIKEMLDYNVTSTGGTTAGVAFEYIEQNIPDATDVIMFTDGFIEDLSHRKKDWGKKWETLWVLCGRNRAKFDPPFGRAVDLDEHSK